MQLAVEPGADRHAVVLLALHAVGQCYWIGWLERELHTDLVEVRLPDLSDAAEVRQRCCIVEVERDVTRVRLAQECPSFV